MPACGLRPSENEATGEVQPYPTLSPMGYSVSRSLARSVLNQLQQAFVRVLGDCLGKSGPFVVFHTLKMSMSACGSYLLWEKNETHFPLLVIFKNSLLIVQRGPGRFKEDYSNQLIL